MRLRRWALGVALGAVVVGAWIWTQIPPLLALLPMVVWAARERERPVGLGGLLVGLGAGLAGSIALFEAGCRAADSGVGYYQELVCVPPDLTPYSVLALSLFVGGGALTIVALRATRLSRAAARTAGPRDPSGSG